MRPPSLLEIEIKYMKYIMTKDEILIKTYSAHTNKRNLKVHITEV